MKKRGIAQKIKYLGIGITLFIQTVYGTGATVNAENLVSTESLIEESESDSYFSYNIKDENNSSETSSNNDTAIETKDDIGVQDDSEDSSTMTVVIIQKVVESIQRTVTSIIKKIFGWFR